MGRKKELSTSPRPPKQVNYFCTTQSEFSVLLLTNLLVLEAVIRRNLAEFYKDLVYFQQRDANVKGYF
jgi:hypothetical protein